MLFLDALQEVFDLLGSDFGCTLLVRSLLLHVCVCVCVCVCMSCQKAKGGFWSQLLCTGTWPGACRHTHVSISSLHLMNASRRLHVDHRSAPDRHMEYGWVMFSSILSRDVISALFNSFLTFNILQSQRKTPSFHLLVFTSHSRLCCSPSVTAFGDKIT